MQSSLKQLDLNPARLQTAPALAPDAPRRQACERRPALPENTLEFQQPAAVGYVVRDSRACGPASNRNGYFARLLGALHESRRQQAAILIRRYGHLLHGGGEASQRDQPAVASGARLDTANGDYRQISLPKPSRSFNARMLTICAIVGFAILHLIGGVVISRASHERPAENSSVAVRGD